MASFFCWGWSDLDKIKQTGAEWHVDCGYMIKIETRCRIQYGGRMGEFSGMSSQSHLPHCRVLPTGESMLWSLSYVSHCGVLQPGNFNGMSSQSHVSHCRVLPLGEFTVMIPEPHATLQGAVTWRNQCHNRATLQGVRIQSVILKIVFRHILFNFFSNAVWSLTSGGFRIVSDTLVLHVTNAHTRT